MLITFINPPYQSDVRSVAQTSVGPPMGLAYLAGAVEAAGRRAHIVDANALGLTVGEVARQVFADAPDVVGLTAATPTVHRCHEIARELRHVGFSGPILVGGPHPTALPADTLREFPAFDIAVAGEAEPRIVALLDALEAGQSPDGVAGLAYRSQQAIHLTGVCSTHPDPESLAPPARHLLPRGVYVCPDGRHAATVIANRGCPAPCTYCAVPDHFGRKVRRRTPDQVADEIDRLVTDHGVWWINFIDDTFTWDPVWVVDLCDALVARGLPGRVEWQCLTRVDFVTEPMLRRMHAAGCRRIEMGIECGTQSARKVLRKKIDEPTIFRAFDAAKAAGMETLAFGMINVPGETLADIEVTGRLLRRVEPDYLQLSYCTPYPGTKLWDDAVREDRLRSRDWRDYRFLRRPVLDNGVLTEEEVISARRRLLASFWLRPSMVLRMGKRVLQRPQVLGSTLRTSFLGLRAIAR